MARAAENGDGGTGSPGSSARDDPPVSPLWTTR